MSGTDLAQALADCLADIEAGVAPAAALSRQGDQATELEALVAAALALRELPPQPARADFHAALAAELSQRAGDRAGSAPASSAAARRWTPLLVVALLLLGLGAAGLGIAASNRAEPRIPADHALAGREDSGRTGSAPARRPRPIQRRQLPAVAATGGEAAAGELAAGTLSGGEPAATAVARAAASGDPSWAAAPSSTAAARHSAALVPGPTAETSPPAAATAAGASGPPAPPGGAGPRASSTPSIAPTGTTDPPATDTATPAGSVLIAGLVKQGDEALAGVLVEVFAAGAAADCLPEPAQAAVALATTAADGRYEIGGLAAGRYLLAAGGGPRCLPRRWHSGENSPGATSPCQPNVVEMDLAADVAARSVNVLFEEGLEGSCP